MREHRVRALLMGGQACVFYGAAEFSRDTDFAILADAANLARLRKALADLQAEVIAVPPFALKHLRRGHAIHFRCQHPEALAIRVDLMARMRGVDSFNKLWRRRTTLEIPGGERCDLLSLPDLVQAKKTQRDKDWPMIRRLVEAHFFQNQSSPTPAQTRFWFRELRTPELLVEFSRRAPSLCRRLSKQRPLLAHAQAGNIAQLEQALVAEETAERQRDKLNLADAAASFPMFQVRLGQQAPGERWGEVLDDGVVREVQQQREIASLGRFPETTRRAAAFSGVSVHVSRWVSITASRPTLPAASSNFRASRKAVSASVSCQPRCTCRTTAPSSRQRDSTPTKSCSTFRRLNAMKRKPLASASAPMPWPGSPMTPSKPASATAAIFCFSGHSCAPVPG